MVASLSNLKRHDHKGVFLRIEIEERTGKWQKVMDLELLERG